MIPEPTRIGDALIFGNPKFGEPWSSASVRPTPPSLLQHGAFLWEITAGGREQVDGDFAGSEEEAVGALKEGIRRLLSPT